MTRLPNRFFTLLLLLATMAFAVPSNAYAKKAMSPMDKKVQEMWGKKRGIQVIQHRVFEKSKRWEFGLFAGSIPNDEVWNYWPVGARIDYFVFESLGIEAVGAYVPGSDTALLSFMHSRNIPTQNLVKLSYYAGLNVYWAPIHGKFSIFNHEVTHFDVGLNFGAGAIGTKIQKTEGNPWDNRTGIYGEVGLGVQLYLSRNWALRVDYRNYFYKDANSKLATPAEITLGFGWFTKAPQ